MQEAAILREYLNRHKVLQLEGFGRLELVDLPATIDFSNQQLLPGMCRILYSSTVNGPQLFSEWLQQQYHLSAEAAANWCKQFVTAFKTCLQQQGSVTLPLLGTFQQQDSRIIFVPQEQEIPLFPNITAQRIIRKDAQHNLRVGDSERTNGEMQEQLDLARQVPKRSWWWVGAVVLGLIAIGSIVIYIRIHSIQWKHQGSYQPIRFQEAPRQYKQ